MGPCHALVARLGAERYGGRRGGGAAAGRRGTCRHRSDPAGLHDQLHVCPRPRTGRLRSLFPSAESRQNTGGRGQLSRCARAGAAFQRHDRRAGQRVHRSAAGAAGHAEHGRRTVCRHKGLSADPRRGHAAILPVQRVQLLSAQRRESAPSWRRLGHRQPLRHRAEHHAGAGAGHGYAGRGAVHRAGTDHHHRHLSAGLFRSEAHAALRAAARALARPCPFRAEGRHGHLGAVSVPDDLLPRVQQSADPSGRRNGGGGVRRHSEYLLPDPVPV